MGRERRKWTAEEQSQLREAVDRANRESRPLLWHEIAKSVPSRSNKDCRRRWCNTLAIGTTKGSWTESEDERLSDAVQEYGCKWTQVAALVGSRNSDQCSSHWSQTLNPDINYSDWTRDEDEKLVHGVQKYGTNWTRIGSALLPKRTRLSLKNRYSALRPKFDQIPNASENNDRLQATRRVSSPGQDFTFSNFSNSSPMQTNRQAHPNSSPVQNGIQQQFNPHLADSEHRRNEFRDPKSYSSQFPFGFNQNSYLVERLTMPGAGHGYVTPSSPLQFHPTTQTQDVTQSGGDLVGLEIDPALDIARNSSSYIPQTNQIDPLTDTHKPLPISEIAVPVQSSSTHQKQFPSQDQMMLSQEAGRPVHSYDSCNFSEMDISSGRSTPSISSSESDEGRQRVCIELECTFEKLGDITRALSRLSKTLTVRVNS
ncbi:hypothetical protein MMC07_001442 [Pseudocyphellaria aurata]|nr:hypothetical protein [Pseudocyphellaria aurata]